MRVRWNGRWLLAAVFALLLTLLAAPVAAQTACDSHAGRLADLHTRQQLKQFVHCAAEHVAAVGWEQAAQDFASDAWQEGSLYLFASTMDGTNLFTFRSGTDIMPGENLWELRDSDQVPVVQEQARIAQTFGGGYVYYRFENIESSQEEYKESYVLQLDYEGESAFIGAGLHPQDTHGTCAPDVVRAALVTSEQELERFVGCAAHHLQQQGLKALHDFNHSERWIAGSTYIFIIDYETLFMVASGGQPQIIGTYRTAENYTEGRVHAVPEMQRILASHDDGYVYYTFRNPATDAEGLKIAYARRVLLDGHTYILASGLYVPDSEA